MILTIISLLLLTSALAAASISAISLIKQPPSISDAGWLTKTRLGEIEERISGLKEVILVADKIDVPNRNNAKEILAALIDNFSEGVKYNFIVPEQYANRFGKEILSRYDGIINLASLLENKTLDTNLFRLHARPGSRDIPDFPYIFYIFKDENQQDSIIAFRGEDAGAGIAMNYRRLEPEIARSFYFTSIQYLISANESVVEIRKDAVFPNEDKILIYQSPNQNARSLAQRKN